MEPLRITITTGKHSGDGTRARIYLTITGTTGASAPIKLNRLFRSEFQADASSKFDVEAGDLGDLLLLRVENTGRKRSDAWFLCDIVVERGSESWKFPHWSWIRPGDFAYLYRGEAVLPHHETCPTLRRTRRAELDRKRARYVWEVKEGLPGHLQDIHAEKLPQNEVFSKLKNYDFKSTLGKSILRSTFGGYANTKIGSWNALTGVDGLYLTLPRPWIADHWRRDDVYGRQALAGVAPMQISRLSRLPENMPVTDEHVATLLDAGDSLETALVAGRLFIMDFAILEGVPMYDDGKSKRYCPAAMCLYYVNRKAQLLPIAIQLGQDPSAAPIFTPADDELDWLAAKMYARCAEANVHQIVHHAVGTHFCVEPFVMAAMRNVSTPHPLYRLLRRHMRYTLGINAEARRELVAEGGVFDLFISTGGPDKGYLKLALNSYRDWSLAALNFPADLAARGVDDPGVLPDYPYRDDGLLLWGAIEAYVRETLTAFYRGDEDVLADYELQGLMGDLRDAGFPGKLEDGFNISTVTALVDLVTGVIFASSVRHASVNFPQYETYSYILNMPLMMREPPPTQKGTLTRASFGAMLPSRFQCMGQVAVGHVLSSFSRDEEFLLSSAPFRESYFNEEAPCAALERFQARLAEVEEIIKQRNETRTPPYPYLQPSRIPCSIAI